VDERSVQRERAQNLWSSFGRKFEAIAQSTALEARPQTELSQIGGLASAKDEIQTYAYAATAPEIYERWGTWPPSGLMLLGRRGMGKRLLARLLSTLTDTSFVGVRVPRLVIELVHRSAKAGELVTAWSQTLEEMPPVTVFFEELEFTQAAELGSRRADLPVGPVMDFLLDVLDRTIAAPHTLVVGSTSSPDTLRRAFLQPGRLERIVEVTPTFPDDVIAALRIHGALAEKRAGHDLFREVDWHAAIGTYQEPSIGDWVHILHSVLRRKARGEAASESASPIATQDVLDEVSRFRQANNRLALPSGGNYV
jgi:ATP-dependent 26S proteasome regulatory subunit